MLSFEQVAAFLPAAILLTLAPGPDILMIVSLGLARGRRTAINFGLGCVAGCISHTLIAAFGVAALMMASPHALQVMKYAGAIYLLWLAIKILKETKALQTSAESAEDEADKLPPVKEGNPFVRGLIANALNPKVIIFYYAFFPQFVKTGQAAAPQILQLGLLFMLQCAVIFSATGYFAGTLGRQLVRSLRAQIFLNRTAALVFILIALFLAAGPLNL